MAQYSIELLMGLPRRAILPCQLAVMSSKMFWIENDVWQQEFKGLWTTKHLDHNPRLEPGVSKAQGIYTNGFRLHTYGLHCQIRKCAGWQVSGHTPSMQEMHRVTLVTLAS